MSSFPTVFLLGFRWWFQKWLLDPSWLIYNWSTRIFLPLNIVSAFNASDSVKEHLKAKYGNTAAIYFDSKYHFRFQRPLISHLELVLEQRTPIRLFLPHLGHLIYYFRPPNSNSGCFILYNRIVDFLSDVLSSPSPTCLTPPRASFFFPFPSFLSASYACVQLQHGAATYRVIGCCCTLGGIKRFHC